MIDPALVSLLQRAREQFDALSPVERVTMRRRQLESLVRAEARMGSDADEAAMRTAIGTGDQAAINNLEAAGDRRVAVAQAYLETRA